MKRFILIVDYFFPARRLACAGAVLVLSSAPGMADWSWPANEETAALVDARLVAKFTFRNDGDKPVTVKDLKFACTCTEYTFDATPAAPGKEGTLRIFLAPSQKKETLEVIVFGPDEVTPAPLTIRISK